jgi:hypothetical protein
MLTPPSSIDRSFLKRAYPTMKKNNPNIPILIREVTGIEPKVWARYGIKGNSPKRSKADSRKVTARSHQDLCQVRNFRDCSKGSSTDGPPAGLSDKEIEDRVSKLVMSEPTPVETPPTYDR